MTVMCHVLSPIRATGQQKEDEFAMGGRATLCMNRVSELMLAAPTTTTPSYFNSRGRPLVGMNHIFLSHRWLYKFLEKKEKVTLSSENCDPGVLREKKERDYINIAKTKIKQTRPQQQHKTKGSSLTSPRIEMSHSHHHSARPGFGSVHSLHIS